MSDPPKKLRRLNRISGKEISIVPYGANDCSFNFIKSLDKNSQIDFSWINENGVDKNMVLDDDKQKIEKDRLEKEAKDAKDKLEKEQKEADEKAALLQKEVDEKVRLEKEKADKVSLEKALADKDALAKELTELRKEAEATRAIAKAERDLRITKEHTDFAKENLGILGESGKLGKLLKEASEKLENGSFDLLVKVLTGANEKIKTGGLFKEFGTDNTSSANTDFVKIDKMANDMATKEGISYGIALSKIFEKDPKLYDDYNKSKGGI